MTTDHPSAPHSTCPSDEFLAAALSDGISDDEQHWLDLHLDTCDRCLDAVGAAMHRLRMHEQIPAAVPAAVHQRAAAAAALEPAAALLPGLRPASPAAPSPALENAAASVRRLPFIRRVFRQPLMIPAALAAAVLLVVGAQTWMTTARPRPMTRSISMPQHARVTARETAVRREPTSHAEVVATVTRGTLVEIRGEDRDWSQVILPDGVEGWIDQSALR